MFINPVFIGSSVLTIVFISQSQYVHHSHQSYVLPHYMTWLYNSPSDVYKPLYAAPVLHNRTSVNSCGKWVELAVRHLKIAGYPGGSMASLKRQHSVRVTVTPIQSSRTRIDPDALTRDDPGLSHVSPAL